MLMRLLEWIDKRRHRGPTKYEQERPRSCGNCAWWFRPWGLENGTCTNYLHEDIVQTIRMGHEKCPWHEYKDYRARSSVT